MIEHETVLEALRTLAQKHPKRKNPESDMGCVYTDRYRKRHCVAGHVAHDFGVAVPGYNSTLNNNTLVTNVPSFVEAFSPRALELLANVQERADLGVEWGDAIRDGVVNDMSGTIQGAPSWARS